MHQRLTVVHPGLTVVHQGLTVVHPGTKRSVSRMNRRPAPWIIRDAVNNNGSAPGINRNAPKIIRSAVMINISAGRAQDL